MVSLLHLYAYPLRPYRVWRRPRALDNHVVSSMPTYTGVGIAIIALLEMLNPWDLVTGIGRAFKYLLFDIRHRHHDIGYANQHAKEISIPRSTWEDRMSQHRANDTADSGQSGIGTGDVDLVVPVPEKAFRY